MENNLNIEELFRSNLQGMEATPPAGGWEAIQAKMAAAQTVTATTATVAKTGLGFAKIAAIITVAVGTGLGVGYIAFKGDQKALQEQTTTNTPKTNTDDNKSAVVIPGDVKLTEISSINKNGKVVSIIEVKKGNETQKILVEYSQPASGKDHSIVGSWLSNDKNKYSQDLINKVLQQIDSNDDEEIVSNENNGPSNNDVKVQKLDDNDVIAGIKPSVWSGNAPLTVEFSNFTNADEYEWSFGDGSTSKEASPRHTFSQPSNCVVTLTVTNSAGKTYTDKIFIEVTDKTDNVVEESSIKTYNIFTPNGDGENDQLIFEAKNMDSFNAQIFDTNGKLIYSSTDAAQSWNGMDKNGNPAPKGTYTCAYRALGKDKKEYKKTYTLQLIR